MSFIRTFSGIRFDPLNPDEQNIRLEDIAHSLSLLCRANGHFSDFFSVGRHSLNCEAEAKARELTTRVRLACLLHDASEAYISDLTRPVKSELPAYWAIEDRLLEAVYRRFGLSYLSPDESELVKDIDDSMMYYEFIHFTGEQVLDYTPTLISSPRYDATPFNDVEEEFLSTVRQLIAETRNSNNNL
jgi:Predicted hydrolases of HD superfamily